MTVFRWFVRFSLVWFYQPQHTLYSMGNKIKSKSNLRTFISTWYGIRMVDERAPFFSLFLKENQTCATFVDSIYWKIYNSTMKHICYSFSWVHSTRCAYVFVCVCRHTNTNDLNEYMEEADLEKKELKKFGFKWGKN